MLWGRGPKTSEVIDLLKANGGVQDPVMRQRVAKVWSVGEVIRTGGGSLVRIATRI